MRKKLFYILIILFFSFLHACKKKEETLVFGTLTDIDGNVYKTIVIGTQTWMAENLKVTRYNNRVLIDAYSSLERPHYQMPYGGDESKVNIYGRLYSGWVGTRDDICPCGWHVPSKSEWKILQDFLIANGYNYDGTTTDNKIAKSMAVTTNWARSTAPGTPGNPDSEWEEYENKSGFSALAGGMAYNNNPSSSYYLGKGGYWWCSGLEYNDYKPYMLMNYDYPDFIYVVGATRYAALSIRCLKDG